MTAAGEDADLRERLLSLLSVDPFNRRSMLGSMVSEMALMGEPPELLRAFQSLANDDVAEAAKRVLQA